MKPPNNQLFLLIHSMTAAEKRYFKRHYASDKNQTTELFDFINSMSTYDENLVKEHFSNSKLSTNLKVYKVQLAKLVLKSLISYRAHRNIESKIRNGLEEINILMEKELYDYAWRKLKKLRILCEKCKAYTYLLEISDKEQLLAAKSKQIKDQIAPSDDKNQSYLNHLFRRFKKKDDKIK